MRIGISGVPGVGKSTFIDAFGKHILSQGHQVAVLTIDPSSDRSGGSILGDKTRMPDLAQCPEAFIRPSPTGGALGGVTRHTRETILLCEAAGFDVVIVETVGVGQSETTVASMTDMFVLLLLPGSGDELQGMKRGIVELADLILVNKADGELESLAGRTAADYANAIRLLRPRTASWAVPVEPCSGLHGAGIAQAWSHVVHYHQTLTSSGEIATRRAEQAQRWLWDETSAELLAQLRDDPRLEQRIAELETAVAEGKVAPTSAARELLSAFLRKEP